MNLINGTQIYLAFSAGSRAVMGQREMLNRINVFPVADGDTGSNLSFTMRAIIENTTPSDSAGETLKSMAHSALIGARGNSGILFAQFVSGLADAIGDASRISVETFGKAISNASVSAYSAISNPTEGTMLTVMKEWSKEWSEHHTNIDDFREMFRRTMARARQTLEATKDRLAVLKKANVIDAGAKGFVEFLHGFEAFLAGGISVEELNLPVAGDSQADLAAVHADDVHVEVDADAVIEYRFCTEAVIRGESIDHQALRSLLSAHGDSLITAGGSRSARIHIHTNDPGAVFLRLRDFGSISNQKVDDMIRQFEMVHRRRGRIALVTDSTCDLPPELMDRYQIHMVPLSIHFGDQTFLDRLTVTSDTFYHLLASESDFPTTSQPAKAHFSRLFNYLSSYYESIVAMHISSQLSGTWANSHSEAKQMGDYPIDVVDTEQISGTLGLCVLAAARDIEAGKSHAEVVANIEANSHKAHSFVCVPTIDNLVRGGRVSPLKGFLARTLGLTPIIGVKGGKSVTVGKARSMPQMIAKVIKMVTDIQKRSEIRSYAVVHGNARAVAADLAARATAVIGGAPEYITDISPVLGAHAGPGSVSLVLLER